MTAAVAQLGAGAHERADLVPAVSR